MTQVSRALDDSFNEFMILSLPAFHLVNFYHQRPFKRGSFKSFALHNNSLLSWKWKVVQELHEPIIFSCCNLDNDEDVRQKIKRLKASCWPKLTKASEGEIKSEIWNWVKDPCCCWCCCEQSCKNGKHSFRDSLHLHVWGEVKSCCVISFVRATVNGCLAWRFTKALPFDILKQSNIRVD